MSADVFRKVWAAMTGSVRLASESHWAFDSLYLHLRDGTDWTPAVRAQVLLALEPVITIQPGWRLYGDPDEQEVAEVPLTVQSLLSHECELAAGHTARMILDELRKRKDWSSVLNDMAWDVTALLRQALDFQAVIDAASESTDHGYIQHPSIEPSPQNQHYHGWTWLIELARQAVESLENTDRARATALVCLWRSLPYPTFRRLVLHSCTKHGVPAPSELLDVILARVDLWMWSPEVQAEFFRCLPRLWSDLPVDGRVALSSALRAGPPREMYRPGLTPEQWERVRDSCVWERLARLTRAGIRLDQSAAACLAELQGKHPEWTLSEDIHEDLAFRIESRWGLDSDYSLEAMIALNDEELAKLLIEHRHNREGLMDTWGHFARQEPARALSVLAILLREAHFGADVWMKGLAGFRDPLDPQVVAPEQLLALMERLPQDLIDNADVTRSVADAIRALSSGITEELRARLLFMWDRTFPSSQAIVPSQQDNVVMAALNLPTGVLAEALLGMLGSVTLERNAGIAGDIRERLEQIVRTEGEACRVARAMLCSRLPVLHDLDMEWCRRLVIPLFDWANPAEAKGAWQGYLWSPWIRPSLWASLREHFLDTFEHEDALHEYGRNFAGIFAAVAIEGDGVITHEEAGEGLRKLPGARRADVAVWIHQKMIGAGKQAEVLWRERVQPWLERAWPREPALRNPEASVQLAHAAVLAGAAFGEAARTVSELVCPTEGAWLVLAELEKHIDLVKDSPLESLVLIDALTPEEPPPWFDHLVVILQTLKQTDCVLAGDRRLRRLEDIVTLRGLREGQDSSSGE